MSDAISVIDEPGPQDLLGISTHAQALAKFICGCQTPLTIGIQGEWGSGKTSLLKMIEGEIKRPSAPTKGRGSNIPGDQKYKIIWINTWEHSILSSPKQALLSILTEITEKIIACDGQYDTARRKYLGTIGKQVARIGASYTIGSAGTEIIDAFSTDGNSISQLRQSLKETIQKITENKENDIERFIIFIDDLDRLNPTDAVHVLELLKNIFSIENCIFVLAIDYQVVVKGLKEKFGEMNEKNEWEFRAFFDKIIQLPFMMPIGNYTIEKYMEKLLIETKIFEQKELNKDRNPELLSILTFLVKRTIGHNPRSLKRMINSLSLINVHREIQKTILNETIYPNNYTRLDSSLKTLMLGLVCIQISFPKLFELLVREPEFHQWDKDFVNRITGGTHIDDKDLEIALNRAEMIDEEEFNEEWEQALFRIIWAKKWQVSRVRDMSLILALIKDKIIKHNQDGTSNKFADVMQWGIAQTSVTSVISTDDSNTLSSETETESQETIKTIKFWETFGKILDNSSEFKDSFKNKANKTSSVRRQFKALWDYKAYARVFTAAGTFIRLDSPADPSPQTKKLFHYLTSKINSKESDFGIKINKDIDPEKSNLWFTIECPDPELAKQANVALKDEAIQKKYQLALNSSLVKFEHTINVLVSEFLINNQENSSSE